MILFKYATYDFQIRDGKFQGKFISQIHIINKNELGNMKKWYVVNNYI